MCLGFFEVLGLVFICFDTSVETRYIHLARDATRWVSSQSAHVRLLFSKKLFKAIFRHSWLQKLYRPLRVGKHVYVMSVLAPADFRHDGQSVAFCLLKYSPGWARLQWEVFITFCLHLMSYELATSHIHPVGGTTSHVCVSSQSRHFDLLYNQ